MGLIRMIKDTRKAFQDAVAEEPRPKPAEQRPPAPRRELTQEEIDRRIYLLNECVTVEGFVRYSPMIDALPGDSAAAVAKKGDDGYFVLIGGEVYGYVWKEKSKELRLRDGKALTVLVEHNGGDPNSYAQLFIPKPTK